MIQSLMTLSCSHTPAIKHWNSWYLVDWIEFFFFFCGKGTGRGGGREFEFINIDKGIYNKAVGKLRRKKKNSNNCERTIEHVKPSRGLRKKGGWALSLSTRENNISALRRRKLKCRFFCIIRIGNNQKQIKNLFGDRMVHASYSNRIFSNEFS